VVLSKIKQFLGIKESPSAPETAKAPAFEKGKKQGGLKDLENFVDYVVRSLVDKPDSVRIDVKEDGDNAQIEINCAKEDMGKVIGKNGKTIMAIRALVSCAGGRIGKRLSVEVIE
jgi:predicted RNA-binding protein YlqC (UPF0109 family)